MKQHSSQPESLEMCRYFQPNPMPEALPSGFCWISCWEVAFGCGKCSSSCRNFKAGRFDTQVITPERTGRARTSMVTFYLEEVRKIKGGKIEDYFANERFWQALGKRIESWRTNPYSGNKISRISKMDTFLNMPAIELWGDIPRPWKSEKVLGYLKRVYLPGMKSDGYTGEEQKERKRIRRALVEYAAREGYTFHDQSLIRRAKQRLGESK